MTCKTIMTEITNMAQHLFDSQLGYSNGQSYKKALVALQMQGTISARDEVLNYIKNQGYTVTRPREPALASIYLSHTLMSLPRKSTPP